MAYHGLSPCIHTLLDRIQYAAPGSRLAFQACLVKWDSGSSKATLSVPGCKASAILDSTCLNSASLHIGAWYVWRCEVQVSLKFSKHLRVSQSRDAISQDSGQLQCLSAAACGDATYESYVRFVEIHQLILRKMGFNPSGKQATAQPAQSDAVDCNDDSQRTAITETEVSSQTSAGGDSSHCSASESMTCAAAAAVSSS